MPELTSPAIQGVPEVLALPSDPEPSRRLLALPSTAVSSTEAIQPPATSQPLSILAPNRHQMARLQGQAIEILGHAIEYLVDTQVFQFEQQVTKADMDAVRIMISASRKVYAAMPKHVPVGSRIRSWLYDRVMAAAA